MSLRTRGEIDLEEAKREHESYVKLLRDLDLDVIELAADESLPESVFLNDTGNSIHKTNILIDILIKYFI